VADEDAADRTFDMLMGNQVAHGVMRPRKKLRLSF
jgi:hypothetical protein